MRALRILFFSFFLAGPAALAQSEAVEQRGDTVAVFFPLDVRTLSTAAARGLDVLQYVGVLAPGKDFYVIGYADYVGRASYNDTLSQARANAVKQHLLASGFGEDQLRLVTGRGEVTGRDSTGRGGFAPDRRVDIVPAIRGFAAPAAPPRDTAAQSIPEATARTVQRLLSVPINTTVVVNNLYFPVGRHRIYPGSQAVLDALAMTLRTNPTLRIRIEGHVCCIDTSIARDAIDEDTGEMALSLNRAKAVMQHLIGQGIAAERLEAVGFGKSKPVVMPERNATDTERNRRVEIRVLSR